MATRTKFYILYWEGKDEDGINMNSLKPCRTCGKITNPYLYRLDNMQAGPVSARVRRKASSFVKKSPSSGV
eukprot:symbB.v1.2.040957.t1/scaffold7688.1/size9881/1